MAIMSWIALTFMVVLHSQVLTLTALPSMRLWLEIH
eukprot:SAG11_NODE_10790_length_805_cov_1.317280_3_plen_35_part_01